MKNLVAEFIGTCWLVLGGCGSAVLGGIAGALILFLIASGKPGFETGGFAANGYGEHSPVGYGMTSALVTEIVMTFMFLMIILGPALAFLDRSHNRGYAGRSLYKYLSPENE